MRKNSDAGSQKLELVPQVGLSQLNTAVTGDMESPYEKDYREARSNLERGINVQWSMQRTQTNIGSK